MKDAYSFDLDRAGRSTPKQDVCRLSPHLRPDGLRAIPMRADTGPIGGNLSHEFIILADTGESEVFCHKDFLGSTFRARIRIFDDVAGLRTIFDKWTSRYAATSEIA